MPRAGRLALLTRCPGRSNCWIYTVRPGDSLWSIGQFFGVRWISVRAMNPTVNAAALRTGQKILIPTPTR